MDTTDLQPLERLTKDLKDAARVLSAAEARYLVDAYYIWQDQRKRASSQVAAMSDEPSSVITWLGVNSNLLESQIKRALGAYAATHVAGQWAQSIVGIGPVISAGLVAHIDITKAPTVGHIWRYAGYDPTVVWEKGCKRPWNAQLKVLCWKIGESFVKVSGNEDDVYGHLYLARKAAEVARNEAGDYQAQAAAALVAKQFKKETQARAHYEAGRLPPAHIHARAKRWAVKLFLAHYHAVAYRAHFNEPAPKPYVLAQLGHAHEIQVPNWPF